MSKAQPTCRSCGKTGLAMVLSLGRTALANALPMVQQLKEDAVGCRRVVALGTCFEYDTDVGYLAESSPISPRDLYAACKHALFLMAEQFQRERGLSFAWPRIFYLYGPWEDGRRLVPLVVRKLLAGEPVSLTPGEHIRDYLHVEEVASAIWEIARCDVEGPVNIGSSRPTRVADIARQIGTLLERAELLRIGEIPMPEGDPPFVCANTQRLRSETNYGKLWYHVHQVGCAYCAYKFESGKRSLTGQVMQRSLRERKLVRSQIFRSGEK